MITVVSGLPRSGTSMMMRMLEAGGLPLLVDHARKADPDNPHGYFEFERVKKLKDDTAWLKDAEGKVVKIITMLLYHLPADHEFKVIFMLRNLNEILASQATMLKNRGKAGQGPSDAEMRALYEKHLVEIRGWMAAQKHLAVHTCLYSDVQADPALEARRVVEFLGLPLDPAPMIAAVDRALYRNRK